MTCPAPVPVSAHHRTVREDYSDKAKASHWGRSPPRPMRGRLELGDGRKPGGAGPHLLGPLCWGSLLGNS